MLLKIVILVLSICSLRGMDHLSPEAKYCHNQYQQQQVQTDKAFKRSLISLCLLGFSVCGVIALQGYEPEDPNMFHFKEKIGWGFLSIAGAAATYSFYTVPESKY